MPRSRKDKEVFYNNLPVISHEMAAGDHIAFRLLEMARNWTPRMSFWKEAEVVELDRSDNTITLRPPAQRTNGVETLEMAEGTTSVTLELSSLKDIRVCRR